jgi:hypothetical protein
MKKQHVLFLFVFIYFVAHSCKSDDFSIGSEDFNSSVRSVFIDTCTVTFSTVKSDSFVTSGSGWIGSYHDKYTGTLTASPYFTFRLPSYSTYEKTYFDSVVLYVKCLNDYFGDTSLSQNFQVYELDDNVKTDKNDNLYSTNSFARKTNKLADYRFKPQPHKKKYLSVKLSDDLGKGMLNKFMTGSDVFSDDTEFNKYFKGLVLVPGISNSNNVVNFEVSDSSVYMVIYYHRYEDKKKNETIDILLNSSLQFTHLDHDKTCTKIEKLNSQYGELSSQLTNNEVYLQSMTSTNVHIDFPYIKNLKLLGDYVHINSAVLHLKPLKNSYPLFSPLPEYTYLSYMDESDNQGEQAAFKLSRDLVFNDLNTQYEIIITDLIKSQINAMSIDKLRINLNIKKDGSQRDLKRLVLGDFYNDKAKAYVEIQLSIYNDEN